MRLAEVLAAEGSKPFRSLAAKLEKALRVKGHSLVQSSASVIVGRLADVCTAAGSGPLSKEFAATTRILEALSSVETSQIATIIVDALASPPKKAKATGTITTDTREMADRLTDTIGNNAKFDALVAELSKLPKNTLTDIAQRFLGTSRQFKSKPEIIKSVRARQLQDALDASRGRRISKIAV